MDGLLFRVLGPFTADRAGAPVDLRGPRHRWVLARLLTARGQVVPTERLVDDVWPDDPPSGATGALHTFVSNLRKSLEPDRAPRSPARVLVTAPPGYALRLPPEAVDAWRFEALLRASGERLAAGRALDAYAAAAAALDCWRGPAYRDFAGADAGTGPLWARAEAGRLAELRLVATERLGAAALRCGRAVRTVTELEAHVAAHPLREEGWRLLALALHRAGRDAEARTVLARARAVLAAELGVDPGPALREAAAWVASGPHPGAVPEGTPDADAADGPPESGPAGSDPAAGRPAATPPAASAAPAPAPAPAWAPATAPAGPVDASGPEDVPGPVGLSGPGHGTGDPPAPRPAVPPCCPPPDARNLPGAAWPADAACPPDPASPPGAPPPAGTAPPSGTWSPPGSRRPPVAAPLPAARAAAGASPAPARRLAGRDAELRRVLAAADAVADAAHPHRTVRIVLAHGEPGSGKTALTEESARLLGARGWGVARGRCLDVDGVPAGWPWVELLRAAPAGPPAPSPPPEPARGAAGPPPGARRGALPPELLDDRRAVGLLDSPTAGPPLRRAIVGHLAAVSRRAPLLLVLDDLHHACAETLAVLTDLLAAPAGCRALVLCTYRSRVPGDADPVSRTARVRLAALAPYAPVRVPLPPLDDASAAALLRDGASAAPGGSGAAGGGSVSAGRAGELNRRAAGNPFLLRETARLLAEEGDRAARYGVPPGVRDVLHGRVGALSASARAVLRQAAVLGPDIDVGPVAALAAARAADADGRPSPAACDGVRAAVAEARRAGLVTDRPGPRFRPVHPLLRDVLYGEVSRVRRARWHLRAAEALELTRADDPAGRVHRALAAAGCATVASAAAHVRAARPSDATDPAFATALTAWEGAGP